MISGNYAQSHVNELILSSQPKHILAYKVATCLLVSKTSRVWELGDKKRCEFAEGKGKGLSSS